MAETEGDARPPPDLADPDRPPPHAGRGMEPRVGGRVRGTGPPRETDVHRVQGLQLRRGEPAPPRGEQRPQSRVDPDLRRTPGRAAGLQDRRRARRQSGRPAHPGRRTPSSFPLNGLTAAVFRAPAGYDAERRGRSPPDPARLLQHPLDLHAPGVRVCDPGRDHPADPDRDRPRQTARRPELRIPPWHRLGDRRGQDARRVAHLHLRPEHRRIDSEVVGPLAGRRLDCEEGREAGPKTGYAGLYLLLSIPLMSDTIPIYVYSHFNQEGKALERNMFLIANFLATLNRVAILGAIWFVAREFFPI